jgi:hypothetical protein
MDDRDKKLRKNLHITDVAPNGWQDLHTQDGAQQVMNFDMGQTLTET